MSHPTELSNFEIDSILARDPFYGGCVSKDQLPHPIRNVYFIVNMDDHNLPGTQWVLLYNVAPSQVVYFDSYGEVPPTQIASYMKRTQKKAVYNNRQLQEFGSIWCGYYCIFVAKMLEQGYSFPDILLHIFHTNQAADDRMMRTYAKKLM